MPAGLGSGSIHKEAMRTRYVNFLRDDTGQDLVEYVFLLTFIALACIIAMQNLGTAMNNTFDKVTTTFVSGS
jgi:Flp pilus assembly pilin Flp